MGRIRQVSSEYAYLMSDSDPEACRTILRKFPLSAVNRMSCSKQKLAEQRRTNTGVAAEQL